MRLTIIAVPYDSGHRDLRMGAGPLHLLRHGLVDRLRSHAEVDVVMIEAPAGEWMAEAKTAFHLAARISDTVHHALAAGGAALVLSGNCASSWGIVAGITRAGGVAPSVVWLDAHGDYNTPETSAGGFLDGMALAVLCGDCWAGPATRVPGFTVVDTSRVIHLGGRDFDPLELERMRAANITVSRTLDDQVRSQLRDLSGSVYLHVDVDAFDPSVARANSYACPGGLRKL